MSMDIFSPENVKGKNIALYFQHKGEVDLSNLREYFIKNGATCFYPVTCPTMIYMSKYDPAIAEDKQCELGAMGIREPSNKYSKNNSKIKIEEYANQNFDKAFDESTNDDSNTDENYQLEIEKSNIDDFIYMDWIFIPGIAFDLTGNRIGYGKGYYDIYLSNYGSMDNIHTIAPAFEFQIVDFILTEKHDVPVNIIVTEERIIYN